MRRTIAYIALLTASALSAPPAAAADDDLDVTMDVIDDLAAVDRGFLDGVARQPNDPADEADAPYADTDKAENELRVVDQLSEMDGEFSVAGNSDGFEHDDATARNYAAFIDEGNFEEGEDVDDDRYDENDAPTM